MLAETHPDGMHSPPRLSCVHLAADFARRKQHRERNTAAVGAQPSVGSKRCDQ